MKKYFLKTNLIILSISFIIMPSIAFAYPNDLQDVIWIFIDIIALLIPLAVALAILFFFWGLAKFILYSSNEEKRKEGKHIMIWGVLALFVMVTIGGIVALLSNTFLGGFGSIPLFFP